MHAVDTTKEVLGGPKEFKGFEKVYDVDTTKEVLDWFWDLAELAAGWAASATCVTRLAVVSTPKDQNREHEYEYENSATARFPETLVAEPVAGPTSSPWRCRLAATPKARTEYP